MHDAINRRRFVAGAGVAFASVGFIPRPASAARFALKLGFATPLDFPINVRAVQMRQALRRDSDGALELSLFPNSVLGSDAAMMSQVRSGALECAIISGSTIDALAPVASIDKIPFAFRSSEEAWRVMDGKLGAYVRKEIEAKANVVVLDNEWEAGLRQITSSKKPIFVPDDLQGLKIRTPIAPLWLDLFKAFGASPAPLPYSEIYTALQTHVADGFEGAYSNIATSRFYEVQKYLSETNHMWGAYWFVVNVDAYRALPDPLQRAFRQRAHEATLLARRDTAILNATLKNKLVRLGMVYNRADEGAFKKRVAPLYAKWKNDYGATAWSMLESAVGRLG